MKATIFAIGVSIGRDTYKNTDHAMTPTMAQAGDAGKWWIRPGSIRPHL